MFEVASIQPALGHTAWWPTPLRGIPQSVTVQVRQRSILIGTIATYGERFIATNLAGAEFTALRRATCEFWLELEATNA